MIQNIVQEYPNAPVKTHAKSRLSVKYDSQDSRPDSSTGTQKKRRPSSKPGKVGRYGKGRKSVPDPSHVNPNGVIGHPVPTRNNLLFFGLGPNPFCPQTGAVHLRDGVRERSESSSTSTEGSSRSTPAPNPQLDHAMCEKQRSRLRNISPKTKLSNDQVELLFQACAERALKGNETDLELVLGLLYSEHFRSTLLARSMVPSLYARNPQAFATCFMKEMIRHQGHRDKETGKLVIEDMFVNARTALFALCYHLKNHGKEMSRSLPPLKISESEPAIPMRTAVNLCYQTAWRHINLDNVVCYTQPTSDPTSFGKHFTPDRMVQPMELACARDVAINFDQPIRENSYALFEKPLIAGQSFIQIVGGPDGDPAKPRKRQGQLPYPEIAPGTTFFQAAASSAQDVLAKASQSIDRVNALLSDENIASVNRTLSNIAALTGTFESRNKEIEQMVAELPATMTQLRTTMASIEQLGKSANLLLTELGPQDDAAKKLLAGSDPSELRQTMIAARSAINNINAAADSVNKLLGDNRAPLRQFTEQSLGEFSQMIRELRALAANLNVIVTRIERDPTGFIFGGKQGYQPGDRQR